MEDKYPVKSKILSTLLSVKFHIMITTTLFFLFNKLSEQSFKDILLVIAGIRTIDKIAYNKIKAKYEK